MIVRTFKEHSYGELSPYEKMLVVMEDDPGDDKPKRRMRVIKMKSNPDGRRTNYNDMISNDDDTPEEPETTDDTSTEEQPDETGEDTGDETPGNEPVSDDTDYSDNGETSEDNSDENDSDNGGEENNEPVSDDTDYSDNGETSEEENDGENSEDSNNNEEENNNQNKSNDDKMNSIREKTHKHILYKKYMELYSTVNGYIESLDARLSDDFTLNKKYKILGDKLKNIKNLISDYMLVQFQHATYIQSLLFYQRIIASIDMVLNLLVETNKIIINEKEK